MLAVAAGGAGVTERRGTISRGPASAQPPSAPRKGNAGLDKLARGGTLNLVGALIAAVATLGITVLVTRRFSEGVAGAFFTAMSAFMILETLSTLGTNIGLVYFIAQLRSLREEGRVPVLLRAAEIPVIVASIVATAVMFIFAGPLAHVLLADGTRANVTPGSVADALRGLAVTIPFASQIDTLLGATRGYGDMRPSVMIDRIGSTVGQLLGVAVACALGSAALLAPLWAVCYVPLACASWWWLRRIRRRNAKRRNAMPDVPAELAALIALSTPTRTTSDRGTPSSGRAGVNRMARRRLANANPRGFWRFTWPRAVAMISTTIVQRLDIVLVAIMKGPKEAAIYTAATRFLVLGQAGNTAISRASQPQLTELFTLQDRRGTNVVYQATTGWLILLTWPIYLIALVYGARVLSIFGHSYSAGFSVMVVLALAQLASAVFGQVDVVLITAGKSSWSLMNGLLVLIVNVAMDFWLIPTHGIFGAAVAWAAAIAVSNIIPLIQLALVFRLHPVGRGSVIATVLTITFFLGVPLAIRMVLGSGWISLGVSTVVGTLLLLVGVLRFRRSLKLQGMPGLGKLAKRWSALTASAQRG
ncbi:MAG TPA: polysaccharide biosynthesis C-terminal domain-containing protein [Streptosporangiaceae bacterium]|jgi:O-antigen/teichoic acid export membrane protein